MKILIVAMLIVFTSVCSFGSTAGTTRCSYPAEPINWIMRYCAFVSETGDEIAIQQSNCFKAAAPDLDKKNDKCKINEKYKTKYCSELIRNAKKHKSMTDCLKDETIEPFFAGG